MAMSEEICENLMKPSVPTSARRPRITNRIFRALRGLGAALVVTIDSRALHEVEASGSQLGSVRSRGDRRVFPTFLRLRRRTVAINTGRSLEETRSKSGDASRNRR